MTDTAKMEMIRSILNVSGMDAKLATYLSIAEREIIAWRWGAFDPADWPTDVPAEYEMTQIYAVVAGFSQEGAEGQSTHEENGINRVFTHEDMIQYIRRNVCAIVKVI